MTIKVTIWNEYRHEQVDLKAKEIYPEGIHRTLAKALVDKGHEVRTAVLDEPEHGLTENILNDTDVLIWWGHMAHDEVDDQIVDRVQRQVLMGMGLIVLHSGHYSKIFKRLMGTSCALKWREADEKERLWVVNPAHPISAGIGEYIELQQEEMYGEHFDIPTPDELVLVSWFEGGEIFRSGCTFYRGQGKIFYFRPGHETYPTYYHKDILQILSNAVCWSAKLAGEGPHYGHVPIPLEKLESNH